MTWIDIYFLIVKWFVIILGGYLVLGLSITGGLLGYAYWRTRDPKITIAKYYFDGR